MIQLPHGAEREYLQLFGVGAIYIGTTPLGERCVIGSSLDVAKTSTFVRRWGFRINRAYWVKDGKTARNVVRTAKHNLPWLDGVAYVADGVACQEVEQAAADLGVHLTEHAMAMSRVTAAVLRVEGELVRASEAGQLGWFNAGFREWRLAAKARGQGMSFAEAQARLRRAFTRRLVLADGVDLELEGLRSEVFPAPTGIFGHQPVLALTA